MTLVLPTLTVDVPAGGIHFPAIYRPVGWRDYPKQYGCTFTPNEAVRRMFVPLSDYGARCRSKFPPEVLCDRVRWLAEELQNREARNLGRDSLFREVACTLTLSYVTMRELLQLREYPSPHFVELAEREPDRMVLWLDKIRVHIPTNI